MKLHQRSPVWSVTGVTVKKVAREKEKPEKETEHRQQNYAVANQ